MVEDAVGGRKDDITELTGRKKLGLPLFELVERDIKPWTNSNALVKPTEKVDDDLPTPVVVDDLKLTDVATVHHHLQELDDDLAARTNQNLALTPALRVCDSLEGVCQNRCADHGLIRKADQNRRNRFYCNHTQKLTPLRRLPALAHFLAATDHSTESPAIFRPFLPPLHTMT